MPRNISFALTTEQFRNRTKTVTRRLDWKELKAGQLLNACVKCMGLKRGEKPEKLGLIQVIDVRFERLDLMFSNPEYGCEEVINEGFPQMSPLDFMTMFCDHHKGCTFDTVVTRIEFKYVDHAGVDLSGDKLQQIESALDKYHASLSAREHGGVAASTFVRSCEMILQKYWSGR